MEANLMKLSEYINNCLLPKLSKEHYEKDHHFEYQLRNNALLETFDKLEFLIATVDFSHQSELVSSTLSHLMILYFEIECTAPWNTKQIQDNHYALKLNQIFLNKYKVNVEDVFKDNQFECQVIFDKCIQEMHKKMTTDNVRKYPGLIEAYCLLIRNVKDYKININPVTVLPVALLLMDDFITANQIKGLKSCKYVLQSLTEKDFAAGNYYEVVYSSLKKNITVREKEVEQALFPCLIEFFRLVPPDCKKNKLDDVFASVLDHLYLESNLYKKAECFDFLTKVIEMHGIHCGKKKIFKEIVRDNLDHCSIKNISDILLLHVLECYEMWLRYCWCMWKLSEDHKMLSTLIKILYLTKDEKIKIRIQKLFVTLVKLCTGEEQKDILDNLDDPLKWSDEDFYSTITKTKWLITRKLS